MKSFITKFLVFFLVLTGIQVTASSQASAAPVPSSWYTDNYGYSLSVYGHNTCVVKNDGKVKCWGPNNESGELGSGEYDALKSPSTVVGITNAKEVQVGNMTTCALLRNGTVKCWGINVTGSVGDGKGPQGPGKTAYDQPIPQTVKNLSGVIDIAGSGFRHCALQATGDVWCWGSTVFDYAEASSRNSVGVPVKVMSVPGAIALGDGGNCAVNSAGSGKCGTELVSNVTGFTATCVLYNGQCGATPGVVDVGGPCQLLSDGHVECIGDNAYGQLGVGSNVTSSDTYLRVNGIDNAVALAGGMHTCALLATGEVRCWGKNSRGQLGVGNTKLYYLPVTPKGLSSGVFSQTLTDQTLDLSWIGTLSRPGVSVNDYTFKYRKAGDNVWSVVADSVTAARNLHLGELQSATCYELQITPISSGVEQPSTIYEFSTKGTGLVEIHLQDADGQPLVLGTYKWTSSNGLYKSSSGKTGTVLGVVSFSSVPATEIKLNVTNALLANGTYVSGTFTFKASKGVKQLTLPEVPQAFTANVTVRLESGDPVPGAVLNPMNLDAEKEMVSDDFVGSVNVGKGNHWTTDNEGRARISGFSSGSVLVSATYDDGELNQSTEYGDATEGSATLTMSYMPIVQLSADQIQTSKNSLVEIPISVGDSSIANAGIATVGNSGVKVSISAPKGASQTACNGKAILSAKTNILGQARLKICASASGEYQVKTAGAVSPGAITVRVSNAAPTSVTSLSAISSTANTSTVAWGPVGYDGNSEIISYKVVAKSGSTTKTFVLKPSQAEFNSKSLILNNLSGDRVWTIEVSATNRFGSSLASSTTVIVGN